MPQLSHPAMVTVFSVTSPVSATCQQRDPHSQSSNAAAPLSGISLPTSQDATYAEGTLRACIAHSPYPSAVYSESDRPSGQSSLARDRLYYSLASTSVYFPAGSVGTFPPSRTSVPASPSYSVHLLVAATHALSTYNRQLASHMVDVAQSYVDLCAVARQRWAFGSKNSCSHLDDSTCLPWHLQAVSCMPVYDIEALLSS